MLLSARNPAYFASSPAATPSSPRQRFASAPSSLDLDLPRSKPSSPPAETLCPLPLSPNSKTAAFFSSPPTSPQPPANAELPPLIHPAVLRPGNPASSSARSLTVDFFATPPQRPTPPASLRSVSSSTSLSSRTESESSVDTPDDFHVSIVPPPREPHSAPSSSKSKTDAFFSSPCSTPPPPPSRSLTADFFAASPPRPTPPPSLRSVPSNSSIRSHLSHTSCTSEKDAAEVTPKPPAALPPLARLFPSRYGPRRHGDSIVRSPRPSFVELEAEIQSPAVAELAFSSSPPPPPTLAQHDRPEVPSALAPGSVVQDGDRTYELQSVVGEGAFSHVWKAVPQDTPGIVVAVKVLARHGAGRAQRVTFQRESEVLQHLAAAAPHPSLPAFHGAFSVPGADVLVLEYIGGGELLDLVNDDRAHAQLSESTLRRMWTELVGAVAWLHERNVVHRDIKLENVLLTTRFPALPAPDAPLIKLTDFGLARAIDPADPWLSTRCGSESYAAPELLLAASSAYEDEEAETRHLSRAPTDGGRHRVSRIGARGSVGPSEAVRPRREGAYDGRETDAWALGVVLFALACRGLPFDQPATGADGGRRAWVRRVLRGEVVWPDTPKAPEGGEALAGLSAVRRIVGRLLVRDPEQRARAAELVGVW